MVRKKGGKVTGKKAKPSPGRKSRVGLREGGPLLQEHRADGGPINPGGKKISNAESDRMRDDFLDRGDTFESRMRIGGTPDERFNKTSADPNKERYLRKMESLSAKQSQDENILSEMTGEDPYKQNRFSHPDDAARYHGFKRGGKLKREGGGTIPPDVEQYFKKNPAYEIDVDQAADALRSKKAKESGGFTGRLDKLRPLSPSIDQRMERTPKEDATRDQTTWTGPERVEEEAKRGGRIKKGGK
jgi:hypothetical protein